MELYEQNEPSECRNCDHICAGLDQCIPAYCTAGNLICAFSFVAVLIPASIRLVQIHLANKAWSIQKIVYLEAVAMGIMGSVKYFLDEFTDFQFSGRYLDMWLFWQTYGPVISAYMLVGFFWMGLNDATAPLMSTKLVWGKARIINLVLNIWLFGFIFVLVALQQWVLPTNKDLIAVVAVFHTSFTFICLSFTGYNGMKLYKTFAALPVSNPERDRAIKRLKKIALTATVAGMGVSGLINSYYIFVWAGAVNYPACQTWIISFRFMQNGLMAYLCWMLRKIELNKVQSLESDDRSFGPSTSHRKNNSESFHSGKVDHGPTDTDATAEEL